MKPYLQFKPPEEHLDASADSALLIKSRNLFIRDRVGDTEVREVFGSSAMPYS